MFDSSRRHHSFAARVKYRYAPRTKDRIMARFILNRNRYTIMQMESSGLWYIQGNTHNDFVGDTYDWKLTAIIACYHFNRAERKKRAVTNAAARKHTAELKRAVKVQGDIGA